VLASRRRPAWVIAATLVAAFFPRPGRAFSNVAVGDPLENVTLRTLDGGKAELLSRQHRGSVFVFFRPGQDHSADALVELAAVQRELAGRSLRFVGVVSDAWPAEEVRETVRKAGVDWPVLVDAGDALYGKLGVRLHPVVGIADRSLKLFAYEHFRKINFREIMLARLRLALGEIDQAAMDRAIDPPKGTLPGDDPRDVARRHVNLARQLWKRGNAEKALEYCRRSLEVAPLADAWALQGEVLAAQGRCPQALPAFDAALKIEPAHAVAKKGRQGCAR
jgi:tetratricopeptide (TPR) repeat protein